MGVMNMSLLYKSLNKSIDENFFENSLDYESSNDDQKPSTHQIGVAVLYLFGILGSFIALLHLYLHQKKNMRNAKQSFMLK